MKDFYPFPQQSQKDWLEKLSIDLKGRSIEDLEWHISEDLSFDPIANIDNTQLSPLKTDNNWEMGYSIIVSDPTSANKEAIRFLSNGAQAISFTIVGKTTKQDLSTLLKNIKLDLISLIFRAVTDIVSFEKELHDYLKEENYSISNLQIELYSEKNALSDNSAFDKTLRFKCFHFKATSSPNQLISELAKLLHQTNQLLRTNPEKHLWKFTSWHIEIGDLYFVNIAVLRAARLMLRKIITSYVPTSSDQPFIEVTLSPYTTENVDQNRISAGARASAAISGGADRLFIKTSKSESDFDKRIALNIQQILKLESYLDHVADPGAGSYYIESMTNSIIEKVWKEFQNLEKENL